MTSLSVALHTFDIAHPIKSVTDFENDFFGMMEDSLLNGARVVLFPEYSAYALSQLVDYSTPEKISNYIWTQFYPKIIALSLKYSALIEAGTAPFVRIGSKQLSNRAILAASGKEIFSEKYALTPWESTLVSGEKVATFEWNGIRIANLICYDCEFPEVAVRLKKFNPHLVLVPSATYDRAGVDRVCRSASARAVELGAMVLVAPLVGTDLANPVVDINLGRCAIYFPAQETFRHETSLETEIFTSGRHSLLKTIDLDHLIEVKKLDQETKPFLKHLT